MKKWGESMGEKAFKLLIVDDEENILNGLKNYIGKHTKVFSKIYCTSNGQEALDMIYQHHPDVMLLDVLRPFCFLYMIILSMSGRRFVRGQSTTS